MNLSQEDIKQWNDAVSQLTAICNKHCTEEHQCEDCPFNSMRFGEYGEPEYCAIRAGVLYTGEHKVTPRDCLRNLKEKRLRSRELLAVVKNCITCHWRNKESNFCPELGIHIMLPDTKLCDQWKPRVDLFEKMKEHLTAAPSTDTTEQIPPQVENLNQESFRNEILYLARGYVQKQPAQPTLHRRRALHQSRG